jgi:ribosomal-protein-alanine N-acetyltransferase
MGYDAYDPYAGRGLFAEGLRLVLNLAFAPEAAGGMGLHRIAAAVQPGNFRSAGLLRSLGFQSEGFSPRLLWLPGADGGQGWRDHVSYVVRAEDWPPEPYARVRGHKVVAIVNGPPGSAKSTLAWQLAAELRIPLFSAEAIGGAATGTLWSLLRDSPVGGVVEGSFVAEDALLVVEGLQRCGLDPAAVPEVWCFSTQPLPTLSPVPPLALGPTLAIDYGRDITPREVVRVALEILAAGLVPPSNT